MSFFYDLNKKLDAIRQTPSKTHGQLNERDMSRAAKGYEKYGKEGMEALAKAGREGKALDPVRKKYDKYDNDQVDEDSENYSKPPEWKGKYLPPVDDRSRPADKPKVHNKSDSENYSTPPEWKKKYLPPVDDRSRPASEVNEGGGIVDGVYKEIEIEPKRPQEKENKMTRGARPTPPAKPSKPTPKGNNMGTIKGGVWTADPPKPGERGVPAPSGDPEGVPESSAPMTAKQKSFAKLAPPKDKITFADKIAGAKKEVDEMLGDVAAEAMRNALSPKQKKIDMNKNDKLDANDFAMLRKGAKSSSKDEMDEERSKGTAFDLSSPREVKPKVGSVERGHKHDIKHTATGRMVTRRTDDQGNSVGADDDSDTQAGPRGRGRPKGTKNVSSKAKVFQRKSKLMTKEGDQDITDQGEYDQEGDMAKDDIKTIVRHAQALSQVLGDDDNLPEWVQSKLAKIEGMMISIDEYMQNQASDDSEEEPIAEKAVSKKQQRFMGMVHAAQKGEKPASKAVGKVAKTMKKSDAEDFASTKHKGLPEKKKKEVDENSEEGRLITKQTGPGQTSTSSTTGRVSATMDKGQVTVKPAKAGGVSYGKGIYDSMNRELELMIAESMSVNMSDSTEGNKSLTVTATDDDAMKLAMILKSAGLGGGEAHSHGEEACDTCGMQDCGCGDVHEAVDENAPDWPTNTETSDDALQYAGGLNKPKTDIAGDGQSTVPVVATHPHNDDLRRIREMAGIKTEVDLGPTSPEVARMSKDEVNAALRSGMSPDVAAMSNDKVNAAFKSGMSPDTSDMNPDSVNAEFGKDDNQYEDSIQRMKEMAGIREAKKAVDEEKTEEGNLFTKGLEDDNVKIGDKIPGTNAIKKKDIDESIFALTNQWRAYKG